MKHKKYQRYTTQSFKDVVRSLVGDEYEVLGEYQSSSVRIKIKHNVCGHILMIRPGDFLFSNIRCKYCNKKNKDNEKELQVKDQFEKEFGNEFKLLSRCTGLNQQVKIYHSKCGRTFEMTLRNFLRRKKCPLCRNEQRTYTNAKRYHDKVEKLTNGEFEVLDESKNANSKVKILHKKCGHIFEYDSKYFLTSLSCPYCNHRKDNHKTTNDDFKKKVAKLTNNEFEVISDSYCCPSSTVRILHKECGNQFERGAAYFLSNPVCPYCRRQQSKKKRNQEYQEKIAKLTNNEFVILTEFNKKNQSVSILHKKCGNIFTRTAMNFMKRPICPKCEKTNK